MKEGGREEKDGERGGEEGGGRLNQRKHIVNKWPLYTPAEIIDGPTTVEPYA